MWELRWVLLGLGALLIIAVYLWGRGWLQRLAPRRPLARRWLPAADKPFDAHVGAASGRDLQNPAGTPLPPTDDPTVAADLDPGDAQATGSSQHRAPARPEQKPDRVITVRFVPKDPNLSAEQAILALRAAGLQHGRYGIFHCMGEPGTDAPWFSVASLTEPGSFDLTKPQAKISGMSFFMVLPAPDDPVACFDLMVATARRLALDLNAELHDDRGSSWSIQRERYVREEIIEYRHQHERV